MAEPVVTMASNSEVEAIQRQLAELDAQRQQLETRLRELQQAPHRSDAGEPAGQGGATENPPPPTPTVTNSSLAADKVALFRRKFAGRTDFFPVRWDNPKSGKSGYAPACSNEWVRGVCGKPQVKCGECPSQAFIAVTNDVIECHLRGEDRVRRNGRGGDFVAGVYGKPRIISCAELHARHVALPRGCLDEAIDVLKAHGATAQLTDERQSGTPLAVDFLGNLHEVQSTAVAAIEPHDYGVLAATTAFGKTVVGARMIAARGVNTLVLVHRRQLVDQWRERLRSFLSVQDGDIGTIGGGKRKPTGRIDIALIQSLVRNGEVSDVVADYGHLIVDECHHLSAVSFELVARRSKARYVLGLSATVARKDGHHPIIFMQCGPVRYRVDAKSQAATRSFGHTVHLRETGFRLAPDLASQSPLQMPALYAALAHDEKRNDLIFDDVLLSLEAGRRPVILTERRDHLDNLRGRFEKFTRNLVVLYGSMSAAERRVAEDGLKRPDNEERLVLATGRYLGEGFHDASLDTLFLTMPISWRGTLAQSVGRLHREHHAKREVVVYDYVDSGVPMLARMALKRQTGYRSLGYEIAPVGPGKPPPTATGTTKT